jgi:hypothetical protein
MEIEKIYASFAMPLGSGATERLAFVVKLSPEESVDQAVAELRIKAIAAVGESASAYYADRTSLKSEIFNLEYKLKDLREEWDATAEFLRTQGVNAKCPVMPQFAKLLNAASTTVETVEVEFDDDDNTSYEDEEDDEY